MYANGHTYDPDSGTRGRVDGLDLERAVVIHMPSDQAGVCTLHWVDIAAGWKYAQLAAQVREVRKAKGLITNGGPSTGRIPLTQAIADCRSADELTALWNARQPEWDEQANEQARGHLKFLTEQAA